MERYSLLDGTLFQLICNPVPVDMEQQYHSLVTSPLITNCIAIGMFRRNEKGKNAMVYLGKVYA
jgi:hypothetical protein